MKKIMKKFLIVFLLIVCLGVSTKVSAARGHGGGYMYDSDGRLIESSVGYTVTEENIFNILSSAWENGFKDETNAIFNSPADMFLYKDKETEEEVIYIVDSESNKLFIFDESLNYVDKIDTFEVDPSEFTIVELSKMNTTLDGKASSSFWNSDNKKYWENVKSKWSTLVKTPFENRKDEERFAIKCLNLSGVYRALRPLRDDSGKIILDNNEQTIYEDVLYLCDAGNHQVLILDSETYKVKQVVSAPEDVDFASKFQPVKIVTDSMGRMYIISTNIYEGILLMNFDGKFMTFVGVNYTSLSFWDALKRSRKTEEQLAQETTILQTSFNNLTIDKDGFLYTVSGPVTNADGSVTTETMIKKINQTNKDVLKRNGYSKPIGDLITIKTGANAGTSNFVAIAINDYGVYTVADTKGNRLFTYDNEGNLLYISGGRGSQITNISIPVAITYQGDDILVLDKGNKCVMRYEPTEFAQNINKAVYYEYIGDATLAADEWQNVINKNNAYELAYVGVGKKYYDEKRYLDAMEYFKNGNDVKYFSRAYKNYRDDIIAEYFPLVGGIILALIAGKFTWKLVKKIKGKNPGLEDGEI